MKSLGKKSSHTQKPVKESTSWGGVADWYSEHLEGGETYHAKVILPNLLRLVHPAKGTRILDLACGEGFIARSFREKEASVVGVDVAPELISRAVEKGGGVTYHVAAAHRLSFAENGSFDVVTCVLALQNMENVDDVLKEVARVLTPGGRLFLVLNHPVLRIPKRSSWGFDEKVGFQYRRLDGYYIPAKEKMLMHPGKSKEFTWSFQRSLESQCKSLFKAGFAVTGLEEWVSHKESEKGPRAKAEDRARKEFPLFMTLEARTSA